MQVLYEVVYFFGGFIVTKISLLKCLSYDYEIVAAGIEKMFAQIPLPVEPGQSVFLKVNLLIMD